MSVSGDRLVFTANRWFRARRFEIPLDEVRESRWREGWFLNELAVVTANGELRFDVFKVAPNPGAAREMAAGVEGVAS